MRKSRWLDYNPSAQRIIINKANSILNYIVPEGYVHIESKKGQRTNRSSALPTTVKGLK